MALVHRDIAIGLIHHSDKVVQYARRDYTDPLKRNGISISMVEAGNKSRFVDLLSIFTAIKRIFRGIWNLEMFSILISKKEIIPKYIYLIH